MSQFTEQLADIGRSTITEEPKTIRDRDPVTAAAVDVGQGLVGIGEGLFDRLRPGGPEVGPNEQLEIDKQTLPPGQFALKYGLEAERARFFESPDQTANESQRAVNRQDTRTLREKTTDSLAGAGSAAVRISADTLAFGARAFPGGEAAREGARALGDAAGLDIEPGRLDDVISDGGAAVADFIAKGKGERINELRAGQAQTAEARLKDSALQFENSDKSLREQFRRIGRDAIISADSYKDNPSAAADVAAEGLGSMIPSLAAAGGARGLATALLERVGIKGVGKEVIETAVTAATVGALEGSGAYGETRRAVLELDEETLLKDSDDYRALREGGMSHEKAREEVSRIAAMEAQLSTTLVAAGISTPFAGFEGGAFTRGVRSLKAIGEDVAGQTVEEAAQNATAQAFQNIALRDNADSSVQLSDDVGQAATEGAIGGLGATAVISAPSFPKAWAEVVADVSLKTGVTIGKNLNELKRNRLIAKERVTLEETYGPMVEEGKQVADLIKALDDPKAEIAPEARAQIERVRDILGDEIQFLEGLTPEEKQKTKPFKKEIVDGDRVKTLQNLQEAISRNTYDPESEAGIALAEYYQEQADLLSGYHGAFEFLGLDAQQQAQEETQTSPIDDIQFEESGRINTGAGDAVGLTREQQAQYNSFILNNDPEGGRAYLESILGTSTPTTQRTPEEDAAVEARAKARADEFTSHMDEQPVLAETIRKTSETLNAASVKSVAAGGEVRPIGSVKEVVMNPVGVDPARITEETKAGMSEDSLKAVAVVEAIQAPEHSDRLGPVQGNRKNDRAGARRETLFQSKTAKFGEIASFNDMVSQLIRGAIRNGREGSTVVRDTSGAQVDAKDVLTDLRKLIQHQQNKYAAATESYEFSVANPTVKKTDRTFDSLSQKTGEFRPGKGSIYVYAPSQNSLRTYAAIAEDLNTGIRAYNVLLEQFPETYQGERLQEVEVPAVPEQNEATQDAPTPQRSEQGQTEQTQSTPVVQDTGVDNTPRSPGDGLQPDGRISFKELFQGNNETNLSGAIRYLLGSSALNPNQQTILSMIAGSSFARANPRTIVRQATAEERKASKTTHGWWDPQKNEIVVFNERAEALLHEMIHATTLEALFQNLASASLKRGTDQPLTATEKAALELNDAALAFMERTDLSPEGQRVQDIMRALVNPALPIAQQDRNMARAISEYMAYGLTVKELEPDLDAVVYEDPGFAKQVVGFVKGLIGAFIGESNPQRNSRKALTALDRLYLNTRTLALDSQTTSLQAREVQQRQAENVTQGSEAEATPTTPEREAATETTTEAPADQGPADTASPVETIATPRFDIERYDAGEFQNFIVFPTRDSSAALVENEDTLNQFLEEVVEFIEGTSINDVEEIFVNDNGSVSFRVNLGEDVATLNTGQPAQAEERSPEETGSDATLPAAEATETESAIAAAVAAIADGVGKAIEERLPSPVPAPAQTEQVSEATPTPETATADAVETTGVENASDASSAEQVQPPEGLEPIETTRVVDQDVGLSEGWTPEYTLGATLLGNGEGPAFMTTLLQALEPKLQPGDTLDRLITAAEEDLHYLITPEMKAANKKVREDAFKVLKGMQDRVTVQLKKAKARNGKPLLQELQSFQNGESDFNPARSAEGRILAWLDAESIRQGEPKFDQHLMMLALMATADYVMNNENSKGVTDLKQMGDLLGISDLSKITTEMKEAINSGRPGVYVKPALARHIQEFMGAKLNDQVSPTETEGVFEALAHEILEYLSLEGKNSIGNDYWFKDSMVKLAGGNEVRAYSFGKPKGWQDKTGKNLLRDVLTSKSSDMHRYSIGKKWAPGDVARVVKKDPTLDLHDEQIQALEEQQSTPFYLSKGFFAMFDQMVAEGASLGTMARILGFKPMANGLFYNKEHELSIEGKNTSVAYSINNTLRQIQEIQDYAAKHGMDPHEVPVYYRISVGTNTRFNFEGFNPQQNKLAREMFSPTRHVVDLTDTKQVDVLYAAIGQSLGVKVENFGIKEAANQARDLLKGKYKPVVDALAAGITDNKSRQFMVEQFDALGGLKEDAFTLTGLWTAKQLLEAEASGATEIETDMYMELDGKTNGPISAAIQHFLGVYSPEILATWRRGGYFLSNAYNENDGVAYHEWKQAIQTNDQVTPIAGNSDSDFYGRVGELMGTSLLNVQDAIKEQKFFEGKPKDADEAFRWKEDGKRAFLMALGVLNKMEGFEIEKGVNDVPLIRIARGATKSLVTKYSYGAKGKSNSQDIVADILDHTYGLISKVGQGDQKALAELREIAPIIDNLLTHSFNYNEYGNLQNVERSSPQGPSLSALAKNANPSKQLLRDFKFSPDQFQRMSRAYQALVIPAFEAAMEEAVDPSVSRVNEDLVKGLRLQTEIYQSYVNKAVKERTKELIESGVILKGHELPKAERNKILKEHRDLAPIIDNGVTVFNVTASDGETSTDVKRRRFGQQKKREVNKDFEVEPEFYPRSRTLSGQRIDSRRDTIGDSGVRVLSFTAQTNSDVLLQTKSWVDPNYPKNSLAVHDGSNHATTNLVQASKVMNESVAKAWHTNTLRPILEAYDKALAFMAENEEGYADLRGYRDALEIDVLRRDARIEAEKGVFTSFQGVPGADAPFVQEGQRFKSEKELIAYLNYETNRIWIESLSRLEEQKREGLESLVTEAGRDLGVTEGTYTGGQVRDILREAIDANLALQDIVTAAFKSPVLGQLIEEGFKVVLNDKGGDIPAIAGIYDGRTKTIYLNVANAEVTAHEMVHATTVHQIYDYYVRGNTTPQLDQAFESIEQDMNTFLDQNFSSDPILAKVASVIKGYQLEGDIASAVAEFIAYGTTNQSTMDNILSGFDQSVRGKVLKAFRSALNTIRKLIGIPAKEYNAVKFWTKSVMREIPQTTEFTHHPLAHSAFTEATATGAEAQRKLGIQRKVGEQVTQFLKARLRGDDTVATRAKQTKAAAEYTKAKTEGLDALSTAAAAGFTIEGTQDNLLFQTLYAVLAVDTKLDTVALQELNQIYGKIMEQLKPEMFERFGPGGQANELQGQRMFAALLGIPFYDLAGSTEFAPVGEDKGGQKLAMFLSLAQTSPELREVLSEIDLGQLGLNTDFDTGSGLDGLLGSTTQKVINRLNGRIIESNGDKSLPSNAALDALTEMLLEYDAQAATEFENDRADSLKGINVIVGGAVSDAARRVGDGFRESAEKSSNDLSKAVQGVVAGLADILVEERAQAQDERLISFLNKPEIPEAIRALYAEMRSIGSDNAQVLQLVKKAKNAVSRLRQEYIEQVPKIIRSRFGDAFQNLDEKGQRKVMKALFKGMGQTDFGIIAKVMGVNSGLELYGSDRDARGRRDRAIKDVKEQIQRSMAGMDVSDNVARAYFSKAEQLAEYMINKNTGVNLLKSAVGILNLHNEDGLSINQAEYKALQEALKKRRNGQGRISTETRRLIDQIDLLASLEALNKLNDETHSQIAELMKTDRQGLEDAAKVQRHLHQEERAKVDINSSAAVNGTKGHMITQGRRKYSVILANNADEQKLREQGYKRIRDYDSAVQQLDPTRRGQSYYFSAHNKLATYNQGVVQTVQNTYSGVDAVTGLTVGPETTGELISGKEASLLNKRMKARSGLDHKDGLIPVFDMNGSLLGFEQAVASDMLPMLEPTQDYADSLGRWAGRIQEEKAAQGLNKELIDAMKAIYDRDAANGRADEYADFGREQKDDGSWDLTGDLQGDPIWREAYFLMPKEAREYAEEVFGGPIKVRRDLINNTFGFRSASVADIWTGKSRLNDELREGIKEVIMATPFLGKDAFKYLVGAEELLQQVVSEVKHVIVVKSGVILVANTLANVVQLATREVPISYMTQRTRSKFSEIETYLKNEDLKVKLRYDILKSQSKSEKKAIQARIEAIDEANRKMSIWPLLEANQFTTISEGLTDSDRALMDGRFMDWVEKKAGELPGGLATVARYGIVAKDTALYQGLAKGVQYGDFISKAIYYDFLTEERGVSPEDAMLKIDQEFINYDLNDSRARSYLESIGLTWFMNFKLRSIKIALDIIRNNPASALLSLSTANVLNLDAGSPVLDNVASVLGDGRLGYSIGPGMIEAGWNLNPWVNLTS